MPHVTITTHSRTRDLARKFDLGLLDKNTSDSEDEVDLQMASEVESGTEEEGADIAEDEFTDGGNEENDIEAPLPTPITSDSHLAAEGEIAEGESDIEVPSQTSNTGTSDPLLEADAKEYGKLVREFKSKVSEIRGKVEGVLDRCV